MFAASGWRDQSLGQRTGGDLFPSRAVFWGEHLNLGLDSGRVKENLPQSIFTVRCRRQNRNNRNLAHGAACIPENFPSVCCLTAHIERRAHDHPALATKTIPPEEVARPELLWSLEVPCRATRSGLTIATADRVESPS